MIYNCFASKLEIVDNEAQWNADISSIPHSKICSLLNTVAKKLQ